MASYILFAGCILFSLYWVVRFCWEMYKTRPKSYALQTITIDSGQVKNCHFTACTINWGTAKATNITGCTFMGTSYEPIDNVDDAYRLGYYSGETNFDGIVPRQEILDAYLLGQKDGQADARRQ